MKHFLLGFICVTAVSALEARPFAEARVTKIINEVRLLDPAAAPRSAQLNDVVRDKVGVETGAKSRSELQFEDNTLTRIGPDTFFSFAAGTRDLTLDRGTMLLQVPKAHGGATIHSAMITASITGTTVMIENAPGKVFKALVLEGSMRVSMRGKFGDSVLLTPGQMAVVPPNATRIPAPVTVDLATVVKTSSLVHIDRDKDDASELPSAHLIDTAVTSQENAKNRSDLISTGYVIHGADFKGNDNSTDAIDLRDQANGHGNSDHTKHGNNGNHGTGNNGHGHGKGHGHGHGNGNGNGNGNGTGTGNGDDNGGNDQGDDEGNGDGGDGEGGGGDHGHESISSLRSTRRSGDGDMSARPKIQAARRTAPDNR